MSIEATPSEPARAGLAEIVISKRLFLINSISSVVARMLNVGVLVWMYDYLLARLSAEEFAIYPVVASVMAITPFFSSLLSGGISRFVTDAYARRDGKDVTRIVSSIFPLLTAGGVVFVIATGLLAWQVDTVLSVPPERVGDAQIMLVLLAASFALNISTTAHGLGFYVMQRFVELNLMMVGRDLLRIAILFILLLGVSTSVLWVVVANVSAGAVFAIVLVWLSRRMLPELRFEPHLFSWKLARRLVGFGMWTTLGELSVVIHNSAGVLILNRLGTAVDVTSYYLGSMFDRQVRQTSAMATGPLQPALTAMHSTGAAQRLGNAYIRGGRYSLWASLMVGVPVSIYSNELIRLYAGNTYVDAALVIVLFTAVYPFHFSNSLLAKIVVAKAEIREFFLGAIGTQVFSLPLMFYFSGVLKMGAVGIAAAIAISYVVAHLVFFWPLAMRVTGNRFSRFVRETLVPGLLPSLAGGAIWGGLELAHAPQTWPELIGYGTVGLIGYLAALFAFGLQAAERRDLAAVYAKVRGWLGQ